MYLGKENTVFWSGRWPRGVVCFSGASVSLYEPEDEPGGDCGKVGGVSLSPLSRNRERLGAEMGKDASLRKKFWS